MASSGQDDSPRHQTSRLKTVAVLVATCCVIAFLFKTLAPQTIGEQARRYFEAKLQSHYVDWEVSIERGTYRPDVGLVFETIAIKPKNSETNLIARWWSEQPAVKIDRLTVFADIDPRKWIDGNSPITTRRITLEGVTANVHVSPENELSLTSLWPPPVMGPVCPQMDLHGVLLNVTLDSSDDVPTEPAQPLQLRWSQLKVLTTCQTNPPADADQVMRMHRRIKGLGDSNFSGEIELSLDQLVGTDPSGGHDSDRLQIKTSVKGCQINDAVVARLRSRLQSILPSDAQVNLRGDVLASYAKIDGQETFDLDLVVHDGVYTDPRLPSKISQVRGRLHVTPTLAKLYSTQATFGDARCVLRGSAKLNRTSAASFSLGQTELNFDGEGLTLDGSLAAAMPTKLNRLWQKYQASGRLNLRARASNPAPLVSKDWSIDATVDCRGIDVQVDKFPYPVQQLVGTIEIRDGQATAQPLSGRVGGQPVTCSFQVPVRVNPDAPIEHTKWVTIQTEGAVAIDDTLIAALTPRESFANDDVIAVDAPAARPMSKVESFVRSLRPRGAIEWARATLQTDANGKSSRQFDFRVTGGSLRYDRFAYPLYNVEGRVQIKDGVVQLMGFTGNNAGSARIDCNGLFRNASVGPGSTSDSELHLRFQVTDLAMDQSLRVSLPESTRHIWDSLTPGGTLDQLDVHVHRIGSAPVDLTLIADQYNTDHPTPDSLSLRPVSVPYRIDVVGGHVEYRDERVIISNLRGLHDASRLVADGTCEKDPSGLWLLKMDLHSGCRLVPDEELIAALPDQVGRAMRGLDLRGPISLRGKTSLLMAADETQSPVINWDLLLQLEGNRISDVGPVHSLRGEIQVRGVRDANRLLAVGDVAIDSMHAYGLQLTSLRGPFSINDDRLMLGKSAQVPSSSAVPKGDGIPIVGSMFGGKLDVSGGVLLSTGDFEMDVALSNAPIATFLSEMGQSRSGMTGRFDGVSRLDGRLGDLDLLKGNGRASLSGANLYQLPFLVQVLNLLRIKATEDVAFTNGETEFSIFGEDVNFNRLLLWGDLVALEGGGTLSRREHLDLSFNTRVSPQNLFSKVISPLRDDRYTLWTIEVDGPIETPTIRRKSLSGITQTMEDWFPGMVRTTTADTPGLER